MTVSTHLALPCPVWKTENGEMLSFSANCSCKPHKSQNWTSLAEVRCISSVINTTKLPHWNNLRFVMRDIWVAQPLSVSWENVTKTNYVERFRPTPLHTWDLTPRPEHILQHSLFILFYRKGFVSLIKLINNICLTPFSLKLTTNLFLSLHVSLFNNICLNGQHIEI